MSRENVRPKQLQQNRWLREPPANEHTTQTNIENKMHLQPSENRDFFKCYAVSRAQVAGARLQLKMFLKL